MQENGLTRYTILHELGRGAIGAVHAARDRTTGAVVALKTLDLALLSEPNPKLVELFLKNARSAAKLRHRSIVRVVDAGEAGGTAYVAMELVEGESLRQMLDERPLSIARAIQIFDDIASALAYAHEEGIVHRGIKPTNIIVSRSGVAKIGDFGTGQIGEAALRYMSPEQVRRDPVDHRSDLFSLGAVLYEMLTRRAPFEGKSPEQIRQSILRAEPPAPSKVNPLVPGALDAFVRSMLAGRPDDRFADARILLRDLQRLEEGLGLGSSATTAIDEPAASAPPAKPELRDDHIRIPDEDFDYRRAMMERESRRERPSGWRPAIFTALALGLAAFGIGLTGFHFYSAGPSEPSRPTAPAPVAEASKEPVAAFGPWQQASPHRAVADRQQKSSGVGAPRPITPPPVAEAIKEPAPAPVAPPASPPPAAADAQAAQEPSGTLFGLKVPSKPVAAEPAPLPQTESPIVRAPEQPVPARAAPAKEPPRVRPPAAKVAGQQPRGKAQLVLTVSPGGDVYINGERHGTTPEITTFDLDPGMHRIEVRSGSRKPYVTYMIVEAGDVRRIRHVFDAKPSRPPT